MERENIKVIENFYDANVIIIDASIAALAKLKKLKTNEEKFASIIEKAVPIKETFVAPEPVMVEEQIDPIEKAIIVEKPKVEEVKEEFVAPIQAEPIVVEPIVEAEMPRFELPKFELPKFEEEEAKPVAVEEPIIRPTYSFEEEVEPIRQTPAYSFEQPEVYKENKLNNTFDYSSMNSINPTEKYEDALEKAIEETIEKQVLTLGVEELRSKDTIIDEKKKELADIIEEEKRIKESAEAKRKEIEVAMNEKKESVKKIEAGITKAKQVDSLTKMSDEKQMKEQQEMEAREARYKEEQAAINEQKNKAMSEIPFDLKKEKEQTPIAIVKDNQDVNLEDGYDVIANAKEFLRKMGNDYSDEKEEGFGRAA